MPSVRELCSNLGFIDKTIYSRGSSDMLVEELRTFAFKKWPSPFDIKAKKYSDGALHSKTIETLIDVYLIDKGAGGENWTRQVASSFRRFFKWPKDSQK